MYSTYSVQGYPDGLPKLDRTMRDEEAAKACRMVAAMLLLPRLGASGVAFLIYHFGDTRFYDSMFEFFDELSDKKLGYLYLVVALFSILVSWLNTSPEVQKARIITASTTGLSTNAYFYKVNSQRKQMPYVVLEDDGFVGQYNRANRSLHHFVEWSVAVALTIPFAGSVFPLPVMILTILFAIGRVWHQAGYAQGSFGSHVAGFYIAALSSAVLEMLVFLCAYKIFSSYCAHCNGGASSALETAMS